MFCTAYISKEWGLEMNIDKEREDYRAKLFNIRSFTFVHSSEMVVHSALP